MKRCQFEEIIEDTGKYYKLKKTIKIHSLFFSEGLMIKKGSSLAGVALDDYEELDIAYDKKKLDSELVYIIKGFYKR